MYIVHVACIQLHVYLFGQENNKQYIYTINFSPVLVWLLIEGASYSRVAIFCFNSKDIQTKAERDDENHR